MSTSRAKKNTVNVSIQVKEDHLHIVAQGEASMQMSIDLWTDIARAIRETSLKRVLLEDYFNTGSRAHFEAVQFAQKLKTLSVPLGSKFAVVCSAEKYRRNDFIASIVTYVSRYDGKIFLEIEDARAWLLSD